VPPVRCTCWLAAAAAVSENTGCFYQLHCLLLLWQSWPHLPRLPRLEIRRQMKDAALPWMPTHPPDPSKIAFSAAVCLLCMVPDIWQRQHGGIELRWKDRILWHFTSLAIVSCITFRMSCRPWEMYCGHSHLCVCLLAAACLHYCTDPDVTWRSGRWCPLVVHYWADLHSVHGLRCYGNTIEMRGRAQQ